VTARPEAPAPTGFEATLGAADAARDRRDWREGARLYALALAANPDAVGLWVQLGHCEKEAGAYAAAEAAYRRFLAARPDDFDIHLQLGHLFNRMGAPDRAAPCYERAAAIRPDSAEAAAHATAAREARDAPEAAAIARTVEAALGLGRPAEAIAALRRLVFEFGQRRHANRLGHLAKDNGDFETAAAAYDAHERLLRETAPAQLYDLHLNRGHLAKLAGDWGGALGRYLAAFEAAPPEDPIRGEIEREAREALGRVTGAFTPETDGVGRKAGRPRRRPCAAV
jgi:tetratricopeptide (TPR) repeat protein